MQTILVSNRIGDKGADAIVKVLEINATLSLLDLRKYYNVIGCNQMKDENTFCYEATKVNKSISIYI